MSFIMECPSCAHKIKLPKTAATATCPKCYNSFEAVPPEEEIAVHAPAKPPRASAPPKKPKPAAPVEEEQEENEESDLPSWISPWGVTAFALATLGSVLAVTLGMRYVTVGLESLALIVVVLGIAVTGKRRQTQDSFWFAVSGFLSILVLCAAFYAPQLLNRYWALEAPLPKVDVDKFFVVPRGQAKDPGKPLDAEEWPDGLTDALRQKDVLIRLESVNVGRLPDKGSTSYLLVYLRLANLAFNNPIKVERFGSEKAPAPVIKDESEHIYAFLEQRPRKPSSGRPIFEVSQAPKFSMLPTRYLDQLLIFEAPARPQPLTLEISSSAWGRKGICKLRISQYFDLQ